MRIAAPSTGRDGMTLLEVLLALAIFLFSLVAISALFNTATNQAVEIQFRSRATRLAQSKLAEFSSGVRSLTSAGQGTFDEEPEWSWQADIQQDGTAQYLYRVTIKVSRDTPDKRHIETSISQYVIDPKYKGTIGGSSNSSSTGAMVGGGN
jgi:type II secretion system protein I